MLAGIADQKDYLAQANDSIVTLAMIETRTALANIDAIAATPGIDGLFLGPSDLSLALSDGKTLDPESKAVEAELDRIVAAAQKAGKVPGAYCASAHRALAVAKRGMRFCAISSDMAFLRAGASAQLRQLKP
jgi:4-hydroxy-2-oxoheptanedioate aldolase